MSEFKMLTDRTVSQLANYLFDGYNKDGTTPSAYGSSTPCTQQER